MRRAARLLVLLACAGLVGCSTPKGSKSSQFAPEQLAKSDVDRLSDLHRSQLDDSLRVLAEKLYRRNPREWRKSGHASAEAALQKLFASERGLLSELRGVHGVRGTDAVLLSLRPDYTGDRVAAYMSGLVDMLHVAFGEKQTFYIHDDLDPQRLYNAARNLEIAAWKLANSRDANGELLLLANEMYPVANLSFEREFGRMIGNLDLLSITIADKTNRTVTKVVQSIASAVFLPVAVVLR